jgi:hypothetical protein
MTSRTRYHWCAPVLGGLLGLACQSRPEPTANAIVQIASGKPIFMGARPAVREVSTRTSSARPAIRRPETSAELILTERARAQIEQAFPDAKGFLEVSAIESELQKQGLRRGKEAPALAAFDRQAKDKWLLFTGNIVGPEKDRFVLPVRYTARDANDKLGLTSTWLPIELSEIRGYDSTQHEPGELMAVLARYNGKKSASPGYDLVLLDRWFFDTPASKAPAP